MGTLRIFMWVELVHSNITPLSFFHDPSSLLSKPNLLMNIARFKYTLQIIVRTFSNQWNLHKMKTKSIMFLFHFISCPSIRVVLNLANFIFPWLEIFISLAWCSPSHLTLGTFECVSTGNLRHGKKFNTIYKYIFFFHPLEVICLKN